MIAERCHTPPAPPMRVHMRGKPLVYRGEEAVDEGTPGTMHLLPGDLPSGGVDVDTDSHRVLSSRARA